MKQLSICGGLLGLICSLSLTATAQPVNSPVLTDAWEIANKLDPKKPADGSADIDKDGYTNLEEFLNRTNPRKFVDYTNPKNNVHTLH